MLSVQRLTVGIGLLVCVAGVDKTGGAVVFVLQLHVDVRSLAKCSTSS